MRKILSLFAAVLMAFVANATVRNITPTHCFEGDRTDGYTLYVELARGAQAGDTIVMADGEYLEGQSIPVNVPVVIMAAEGAHPVVKMSGYFQVHASAKVEGVKFQFVGDAGNGYCFYFYENTSKYLVLEGCEFQDFTQYCVSSWEDFHVDSILVNNCYFHNLAKGPFYLKASAREDLSNTCDKLKVTNCTFNDIDINGYVAVIDFRNNDGGSWTGNANELLVDHCTFYNIHGEYNRIVMSYKSANAVVSNCVFAQPTDNQFYPTYNYGGSILNNLTFNTKSHRSGPTITGAVTGDPLFVDAANGDLHLSANSPAIGAGTDGSTLGDPRWYPIIGAPEYYLVGTMNNWAADEAYKFIANPVNDDEYMLSTTLVEGDSLKVIGIVGNTTTWYPDNADNYYVDAAHAGEKDIYFRPDGQGGNDWYYGVIYIAPNENAVVFTKADFAGQGTSSSGSPVTATKDGVTFNYSKGYCADESLRCYAHGALEITSAEYLIEKINFTTTGGKDGGLPTEVAVNAASYSVADLASQARFTEIKVTLGDPIPAPQPKFYVTGDSALVTDGGAPGKAWDPSAIKSMNDTLVLNLKANQDYVLKVTLNGTWQGENNVKGYNELTEVAEGLKDISNDHNIGFKLNEAGEVKVIYTAEVFKLIGDFYVEPTPVVGCDWDNIGFVADATAEQTYGNQFKVCKEGNVPNVENIQAPAWATAPGIYMTFPDAVIGEISLPADQYKQEGAGVIFYLSAFTAKETEFTVQWQNGIYNVTVYNENGIVPATPKFYVTGDSALVADGGAAGKAWNPDAIPSMNDTLVLNLKAGVDYLLKVTLNGTWQGENNVKGYNELTEKAKGLKDVSNDHNIGFKLNEAGEVKVIYTAEVFKLIGNFYVEPVIPAWAEVRFTEVVPKSETDKPLNDSIFTVEGSALTVKMIDPDGKMEIDANPAKFGTAEENFDYALRLKSGGKSAATKNYMLVNVPEEGELVIAARTGSNSATDRTIVVMQGADTLYNAVVQESQKIDLDSTTSCYPYIVVPVAQGQAEIRYPIGAMNFYGIGFRTLPEVHYYMKNNWNAAADWTWKEMTKDGKVYKLDSVVYGGNGVNYNIAESDEGAAWVPDSAILGADIEAKDTVSFVLDPAAKTVTATLIGKYVKPAGEVSCAEIYALADSAAVLMNGVVVTYVNGKYVYVKDATGAMLIYLKANATWKAGDVLSNVRGMKVTYNGLVEVTPTAEQVAAVTALEGTAPAPEVMTAIDAAADMSKYILLEDVTVLPDTFKTNKGTTAKLILGNDTLALYNGFKQAYVFEANKKYDVVAAVSYYKALQLNFISAEEHAVPTHTYTVAGSPVAVFGSSWTPSDTLNDMTLAEGDSLYRWEKANLTLAAGEIAFKVAEDHAWTHAWPASDYKLAIAESGIYTIKITFNPATQAVAAEAIKTGEAVVIPTVVMHGNFTGSWADTELFTLAADSLSASLALTLEPNTYEFGMKFDGTWKANGANLSRENPSTSLAEGNGNMHMVADMAGEYVFTYTFASQTLAVAYPSEPMDSIPTTAPAAPTAAEDDVLAIYCNKYTTNNLNFGISGWPGPYETLNIDNTNIGYFANMTWECIIDPAHTDDAHDMSGYKKLHVDIWAPKAAKIKFTVEAVNGGNYKDGNMVDLAKGWNAFDFVVAEWPGNYDFKNVKCFVWEMYQNPAGESFEHNPFAFANIYFYEKEAQGLENIDASTKAVKVLYNGQILILRGDKIYTVTGQPVK